MADLSLPWGGDLSMTPSGDLQTVDGDQLAVQRVSRRLLTPPQALLFHKDYGAGLPQKIGSTANVRTITGLVRAQIFKEGAIAQNPAPAVTVEEVPRGSGMDLISVRWVDKPTGAPLLLQFAVGP